ncbi:MAG: hypothetical protein ACYSSP_08310 [Planctomycetota bacterium]|jgi:hypothetical protein
MVCAEIAVSATTLTIIFIILAALIGAIARRVTRDKCLKDFAGYLVTLERNDGQTIWGKVNVENTGLEFIYPDTHKDEEGHDETTYVLYKNEYPNIHTLLRFHDQLNQDNQNRRQKELDRTYHPPFFRRMKRKITNLFKTIRDSILEVINLLVAQAKKTTGAGTVLSSQDKYVSQMKQQIVGTVGTSYEPLLEKYIGHKVVLEIKKNDKDIEYCGVLKDYTSEFISVLDVYYKLDENAAPRKCDLITLRSMGTIRHLAE